MDATRNLNRERVVFNVASATQVCIDLTDDPIRTLACLKNKVRRDSEDILRHVQRINACIHIKNSAELTASIADLFIALQDDNGNALRRRMLNQAASLISMQDHHYFSSLLSQSIDSQYMRFFVGSVLSLGLDEARVALFNDVSNDPEVSNDPLTTARSHIEAGELLEAQYILEDAWLAEPHKKALEAELLTVYRFTQDYEAFKALSEQLRLKQVFPSLKWRALEKEFDITSLSEAGK